MREHDNVLTILHVSVEEVNAISDKDLWCRQKSSVPEDAQD
jgi:hypothetical protein